MMPPLIAWLPSMVAIITGIITISVTFAVVRAKVESLGQAGTEIKKALDTVGGELQNTITAITVLSKEQAIINQFMTKTLDSIAKRIEYQDHKINEQEATVKLLVELVKRLEDKK